MMTKRPLPQPITPETQPYWDGLRAHKLLLPNCARCGPFLYPRAFCPHCHSRNLSWIQASGRGTLHSFEIVYHPFNSAFKDDLPYVLAMIELEEGPRLMSNLIGIEPDATNIKCDMPVEVVFEKLTDEITIPLFRPTQENADPGT